MIRSCRFSLLVALVSLASFSSRSAYAGSHDTEAAKLRQAAIYQDYLATDFGAAQKKLTQALALCAKPADCAPATRARLHCDLGAVFFAEQNAADGRAQFAAALQEDPSVALDPDLTSPDLQREFAAIKSGGQVGASEPAGGAQPPAGPAASGASAAGRPASTPATAPNAAAASGTGAAARSETVSESAAPAGRAAPKLATSDSDCPPGFPGCTSSQGGATCSTDDDCGDGEKCVDEVCRGGKEDLTPAGKRNWVSLAFQLDVPLLPAKTDVCLGGKGYSCFNENGSWYAGMPLQGGGGEIQSSGLQLGTKVVIAGFDHAFFDNLTLGGGLGFAFGGGPTRTGGTAFLPVRVEARGKYWFGHHPMGKKGFRFYVMAEGGMAEVAASIQTFVYEAGSTTPIPKNAWFHMGRGFAGAGLGSMLAVTRNMGVLLELRATEMFPTTGQSFGAQIAYAVGF